MFQHCFKINIPNQYARELFINIMEKCDISYYPNFVLHYPNISETHFFIYVSYSNLLLNVTYDDYIQSDYLQYDFEQFLNMVERNLDNK